MENLEENARGLMSQLDRFCAGIREVIAEELPVGAKTEKVARLREKALAEIEALDAGSWFAESFAGERVPTLDAVLAGYEQENSIPAEHIRLLPALMTEALIAEAVMPIAATGSFGRIEGFRFLQMISRKVRWLEQNGERLVAVARV